MRNVLCKSCTGNHKHTFCVQQLVFSKVMPFMRKGGKILKSGAGHVTLWRMHIAFWIHKATNTHSEYVILIAFPPQQLFTNVPQCYAVRTLLNCYVVCQYECKKKKTKKWTLDSWQQGMYEITQIGIWPCIFRVRDVTHCRYNLVVGVHNSKETAVSTFNAKSICEPKRRRGA
jgi:hypothetical protein